MKRYALAIVVVALAICVAACGGRQEPDIVQDPALTELCAQACPSADRRWLAEESNAVWCNCGCHRSIYKIAFSIDDILRDGPRLSEAIWGAFEKQYCQ